MKHDQKRGESLRDRADVSSLLCNFTNVFCDRLINNSMLFSILVTYLLHVLIFRLRWLSLNTELDSSMIAMRIFIDLVWFYWMINSYTSILEVFWVFSPLSTNLFPVEAETGMVAVPCQTLGVKFRDTITLLPSLCRSVKTLIIWIILSYCKFWILGVNTKITIWQ